MAVSCSIPVLFNEDCVNGNKKLADGIMIFILYLLNYMDKFSVIRTVTVYTGNKCLFKN